ncbi:glycoside hydrolase family 43 protein [Colletotrichum scovillei]|uniref:Glycoside hydrolase family 43 protein n=1 Tax=Colletotrichum scovillei TaxID=1209932 RepID=A0A9P7UBZ9_9PEZI|nr:glycoside hydrolase family 43 protein [Colletotrichum scovillei]KAG7052787.1 glycoside hydrolase family 43 protein [Colletotrichum scovillei]KAG7065077.1 glycoside hydrolase family 43 protein [Colletotrichum scovillei]
MIPHLGRLVLGLSLSFWAALVAADNSTFYNPILPGWHSDPSCIHVDGTFYCITSSFITFPGLPVYASKDLINWKLIRQQEGFYAATIRYHDGEFWVVCEYLGLPDGMLGTVFKTSNPFDAESWSDPYTFLTPNGDLDLFWDDDGKMYIPGGGHVLLDVDLEAGTVVNNTFLWAGTGGVWPEGPHLYRKDGWYYISAAEGGTETGHYQVMARSSSLTGPYQPCPYNPVLTNKGTDEYFQTIGHADLFQDSDENWWGVALATRSGPEWRIYPMGRETVLYPVTWREGEWPILEPVRGKMSGWQMPAASRDLPGDGPFNSDPDAYDFTTLSGIPRNLIHWRVPTEGAFSIDSSRGLHIVPSRANLTGDNADLDGRSGLSFIGRPQTDSLFTFEAVIDAPLTDADQESGVTLFLTQFNHADIGVVILPKADGSGGNDRMLRFRATGEDAHAENIVKVPEAWGEDSIRFQIATVNSTHCTMAASQASQSDQRVVISTFSARLVSGQSGPFTGSLVGVYATCNGAGSGVDCPSGGDSWVKEWHYEGQGQYYTATDLVPE